MMQRFGSGQYQYELAEDWGQQVPDSHSCRDAVGVAVDSQDRVYLSTRGVHPVLVLDRNDRLLGSWSEGVFARPHGITYGPDDTIYCVDDAGHYVRIFTLDGKLLLTIGTPVQASDTGWDGDYDTLRGGPPFN